MGWMALVGLIIAMGVILAVVLKIREWFRHLDAKMDRIAQRVQRVVRDATLEIQTAASLGGMPLRFPIFFGGWSIDSLTAKFILQHLVEARPSVIVELGSGTSSILIAHCNETIANDCRHIAIDHDRRYLDLTKAIAASNALDHRIEFLECALGEIEMPGHRWYQGVKAQLSATRIDMLLIDGPPGHAQKDARYPALPVLYDLLAEHCTVILDDARRPDERSIAERWQAMYPEFRLEFLPGGHQPAVLRR